ncbi:fimbrial chaperone [Escherichia coli]|nr:fimbrial chaperone [Escherichia coli]EIY9675729.1 fimbrial chaperone [Escherichia coli]EJA4334109.1 fimbrial chaperone [Escherichia coli]HBM8500596.1 fimbrial chaperone [Escherichia coli]HDX7406549.1 fimbrial chaperone [Escherichia coli]
MKNMIIWCVVLFLPLTICNKTMAAFTLGGTRFIYEEGRKNTSFDVTNDADKTYGGQVWIDNQSKNSGVYMVPTPPFFKLAPKQTQILRILKTEGGVPLPEDRESLFWLNVQEIPPKAEKADDPILSIALNSRVKLFYRPRSLVQARNGAEKRMKLIQKSGITFLKNPTPYYFAITKVKVNGQNIHLSKEEEVAVSVMAPFSELAVKSIPACTKAINVETINDWGNVEHYTLKGERGEYKCDL